MSHSLYLFNPDHDLALANGDENFNAPLSAKQFAKDLACLPMWYAAAGDIVFGTMPYNDWMTELKSLFPRLASLTVTSKPDLSQVFTIRPWGWNAAVSKSLLVQGLSPELMPSTEQMAHFRSLSHRETAIRAMNFLQTIPSLKTSIPPPAQLISSEKVKAFIDRYPKAIFKAPWSGSGKGLCWANGTATENIVGWCRNIVEKQGAVVAEEAYDKLQDFAMEFLCENGKVAFVGYSLFSTERGVYRSNELMSDQAIENQLIQKQISLELLREVQRELCRFLTSEIAPVYSGYLGVDMFIYQQNDCYLLHPCVEINLRMTMGMVARIFYDRFVSAAHSGKFYIDYFPSVGALFTDHEQRITNQPLRIEEGRINHGYMSLSPIGKNSHYRARVEIE
ncbi:MAG: hypothetical protein ACOYOT_12910 [Bacteroidales bacterium]